MEKRIVVAGCRDYYNYNEAKEFINHCLKSFNAEDTFVFLSGNCRGADQLGERFAEETGLSVELYPAEWKKHGKAAGPIRNKKMVAACDAVICFWDGKSKGTRSLIQYAKEMQKPLAIKMVEI